MGRGKRVRAIKRPQAPLRVQGSQQRTIVVPDVHGRLDLLRDLLQAAGALDDNEQRVPGLRVVGLGDLVHGTVQSEQGDERVLERATDWLDTSLLGNHEAALLGLTSFEGVWRQGPVASRVRSLVFRGFYVPALLEGETLLTHAGVAPELAGADAQETYARIMDLWAEDPSGPVFQAVSHPLRTKNPEPVGGVLWLHWGEARAEHISQLVGHTPQDEPDLVDYGQAFHLNLDASTRQGTRLSAAVLENGEPVEIVTIERDLETTTAS